MLDYQTYSTVRCTVSYFLGQTKDRTEMQFFVAFLSEIHIYHMVRGGSETQTEVRGIKLTAKHLQIRAISWLSGSLLDSFKCEEGPVFRTATHNNLYMLQLCTSGYGGYVFASKIWLIQTEEAFIV